MKEARHEYKIFIRERYGKVHLGGLDIDGKIILARI
jgi:hypothetical protein